MGVCGAFDAYWVWDEAEGEGKVRMGCGCDFGYTCKCWYISPWWRTISYRKLIWYISPTKLEFLTSLFFSSLYVSSFLRVSPLFSYLVFPFRLSPPLSLALRKEYICICTSLRSSLTQPQHPRQKRRAQPSTREWKLKSVDITDNMQEYKRQVHAHGSGAGGNKDRSEITSYKQMTIASLPLLCNQCITWLPP